MHFVYVYNVGIQHKTQCWCASFTTMLVYNIEYIQLLNFIKNYYVVKLPAWTTILIHHLPTPSNIKSKPWVHQEKLVGMVNWTAGLGFGLSLH